ncbi:hypothetical protein FT663_05475 [Candidozyma haemuli var. vulneris]|uniref:Pre-mRNA-splicing factor SYF2 n=1 Tax=Candidozyma haemuli TaxID=45357 RepID=A0A2V1ARC0_9ASCO|nr:hypothetical protein CXQ85_002070 [[Candida] haemuloni]KAF3984974.1 hypothetical protein FT663_05475 [[Candida] haemuloni var. vulneris]KAF3987010.1 hypothetical protein FT662_04241 [[Candida] haemuloni var. vulneris]PVH20284.1 hypothetical protein CXQ85_002070 [[Candida] haemuloni]
MDVSTELKDRVASFREKKEAAIRANAKAVAEDLKKQRDRAHQREEIEDTEKTEKKKNDSEYTLQEWKEWTEKKANKGKQASGGYKNLEELAHSTYEREVANMEVDKEKYAKSKEGEGKEDVDALVRGLEEASERRLKRRRTGTAESNSINEKNRQFNMKLEREQKK